MSSIYDETLADFRKELARLKTSVEESNNTLKQYLTEFPEFASSRQASQYMNTCDSVVLETTGKLQRYINNVKSTFQEIQDLKEVYTSDEFKQLNADLRKLAADLKWRDEIEAAEDMILKITSELNRLKGDAKLDTIRGTDHKDDYVKAPAIEIPVFNGDIKDWPKFWNPFNFVVHSKPNIPKEVKYTHLMGKLKGHAALIIDALDISAESYEKAIAKLHELYADEALRYRDLSTTLTSIAPAGHDHKSISEVLLKIEMVLGRLDFELTRANSSIFIALLSSKFPSEFLREVNRTAKARSDKVPDFAEWLKYAKSALDLMKDNDRTIKEQCASIAVLQVDTNINFAKDQSRHGHQSRDSSRSSGNANARFCDRNTPRSRNSSRNSHGERHSRDRSTSSYSNKSSPYFQYKGACPFCSRAHKPEECKIDVDTRRDFVREDRRCWSCFALDHASKHCKYICKNCERNHHASLCKTRQTSVNFVGPSSTHGMMIGQAPVHEQEATIYYLLDTGSDYSYILRETVEKLKLEIVGNRVLEIKTFGDNKPEPKMYDIARLNLVDIDRDAFTIDAFVVEKISDRLQVAKVNDTDRKFLAERKLSLITIEKAEVQIDLLIGLDHFFEQLSEDAKQIRLPSGLHYIPTRCGGIVAGRAKVFKETVAKFHVVVPSLDGFCFHIHAESNAEQAKFDEQLIVPSMTKSMSGHSNTYMLPSINTVKSPEKSTALGVEPIALTRVILSNTYHDMLGLARTVRESLMTLFGICEPKSRSDIFTCHLAYWDRDLKFNQYESSQPNGILFSYTTQKDGTLILHIATMPYNSPSNVHSPIENIFEDKNLTMCEISARWKQPKERESFLPFLIHSRSTMDKFISILQEQSPVSPLTGASSLRSWNDSSEFESENTQFIALAKNCNSPSATAMLMLGHVADIFFLSRPLPELRNFFSKCGNSNLRDEDIQPFEMMDVLHLVIAKHQGDENRSTIAIVSSDGIRPLRMEILLIDEDLLH